MTTLIIEEMSLDDKLRALEALWESLSAEEDRFESPAWHADLLHETQKRYEAGLEQPIDWGTAKQGLRKQPE